MTNPFKKAGIYLIAILVIMVDFRLYFMSLVIDGVLIAILLWLVMGDENPFSRKEGSAE